MREFFVEKKERRGTARVRAQKPFKKEATKKEGGEFRKGRKKESGRKGGKKKKAKCKKSTRTSWWNKIRKSFVGAFTRKRNVEKEEQRGVEVKRCAPGREHAWDDREDGFSSFCCWEKEC